MATSARSVTSSPLLGDPAGFLCRIRRTRRSCTANPKTRCLTLVPHRKGAQNTVPSFITRYGPIREVRFQRKPDGAPDGGVHALFTIVGRSDIGSSGCTAADLPSTDFETEFLKGNLSFRIPTPTFGLGLIEAIQDLTILKSAAATAPSRASLGINGIPNRSGNDGTIARLGWKAQNKSLTIFAGEAYNVEMGVTNDVFPTARDESPDCNQGVNEPNDTTRTDVNDLRDQAFDNPLHELPDWLEFAVFMRQLAPPEPAGFSASALRGQHLFGTGPNAPGTGCFLCHTPSMMTGPHHETEALQDVEAHLYSDLLIHHMGASLADNVTQGLAQGDMFRTSPLWGIGQRFFFLHDGRTSDLLTAINAHADSEDQGGAPGPVKNEKGYPPSEANAVIRRFQNLPASDKQAILDFLRSL